MLAGGAMLGSCDEHNAHIESPDSGGMNVVDGIVMDRNTTQTINIRASVKPVLTCDAEWLKIGEPTSLTTGIYTVELTAQPNGSGETRIAVITVTAGKESSTMTVTQLSGDVMEIRSVNPQGELDPNGGTLTVGYAATGTPAVNLPEWISVSGSRAIEEGVLTLTYLANYTGRERSGIIVLAVGKDAVANVTVRQPSR